MTEPKTGLSTDTTRVGLLGSETEKAGSGASTNTAVADSAGCATTLMGSTDGKVDSAEVADAKAKAAKEAEAAKLKKELEEAEEDEERLRWLMLGMKIEDDR